ncbi:MAG: DUF411 domain-containing protein [Candidatus Competibacteraceae bacterium]|nr:DUF411 domain-containing protein [Candidatus Competibacteraceae bacterium]
MSLKLLTALALTMALLLPAGLIQAEESATAGSLPTVTVYRSPTCGCCHAWIEHLEHNGFTVEDVLTTDIRSVKEAHDLPPRLASCHTALVDGYLIEGHVPAADIKNLLIQRPTVAGLAVPGMPVGSPGMEVGERRDAFPVVSFDQHGQMDLFNSYPAR